MPVASPKVCAYNTFTIEGVLKMAEMNERMGMGWVPDYPDFRDFDINKDDIPPQQVIKGQKMTVKDMLSKLGVTKGGAVTLDPTNDLRQWCSPIEDQQTIGS